MRKSRKETNLAFHKMHAPNIFTRNHTHDDFIQKISAYNGLKRVSTSSALIFYLRLPTGHIITVLTVCGSRVWKQYPFAQAWKCRLKFCNSFSFQAFWPKRFWMRTRVILSARMHSSLCISSTGNSPTRTSLTLARPLGEGSQHGCARQFVHMKTASIRAHTQWVLLVGMEC